MSMIIAVDFDGTVVEHQYPEIGKEIPKAFEVLKLLKKAGHKLILWTYRDGKYLTEAVNFCKQNGVNFYAVNNSEPNESYDTSMSRKIHADIFIDDRNIGGFLGWERIQKILIPHTVQDNNTNEKNDNYPVKNNKKNMLSKILKFPQPYSNQKKYR